MVPVERLLQYPSRRICLYWRYHKTSPWHGMVYHGMSVTIWKCMLSLTSSDTGLPLWICWYLSTSTCEEAGPEPCGQQAEVESFSIQLLPSAKNQHQTIDQHVCRSSKEQKWNENGLSVRQNCDAFKRLHPHHSPQQVFEQCWKWSIL